MSYVLFVSENKIKDSTAINGNVDMEFIVPYVRVAQKKYIESKLGTDLFEKLQNEIKNTTLTGDYKTLVDDYIADALVHWAFYECMPFLRFKVQNNSIVSKQSETGDAITREDAQNLREEVRNTAEFYTDRLIEYIRHNKTKYPEYDTNTGADVRPDRSAYYSGMNLERGKCDNDGTISIKDFLTPDLS